MQAESADIRPTGVQAATPERISYFIRRKAEDRSISGRALREGVPREAHGWWEPTPRRPHPVDVLELREMVSSGQRSAWLDALTRSSLDFFERSAALMAHDLAATPTTGIPVQLCGNCHPGNFGVFRASDGTSVCDLRDCDETLPGPWEWDVKRLATGLLLAGQHIGLKGGLVSDAPAAAVQAYRQHMIQLAAMRTLDAWNARVTDEDLLKALMAPGPVKREGRRRRESQREDLWSLVTHVHSVDGMRRIAEAADTVVRLKSGEDERMRRHFWTYRSALSSAQRDLVKQYRLVDAVRLVGGAGGQVADTFIWLLEGKDVVDTVFLQVKEARHSVLEPYVRGRKCRSNGLRVLNGAQRLGVRTDPFFGRLRGENGREYVVRDAQYLRSAPAIGAMGASQLIRHAEASGRALARAHARSGDRIGIAAYLGEGKSFDRAITDFASIYSDQVERDFRSLTELRHRSTLLQIQSDYAEAATEVTPTSA